MTTFMTLWNAWAHLFRAIPYGDPYMAAFVLVIVGVMGLKMARSASKLVMY